MDSKKVATTDKWKRLGYLDTIKVEVNLNQDIEATLLIGSNYVKALEPPELVASKMKVYMHSKHYCNGAL